MSEPGSVAAVGEYRDPWSVSSTLSNPGSAGGVSTQLSQVSDGSSSAVQTPGSAVTTRGDNYQGLRPQELQEAKDTLIVETSDMLRVPLFTAEVLLRHHGM